MRPPAKLVMTVTTRRFSSESTQIPRLLSSVHWCDGDHRVFARPKLRKEIKQLLPRRVFLVQQLHAISKIATHNDLRARLHPITQYFPAHIARRDAHLRIVANALHLAAVPDGVNNKPS